MVAIEDDEVAAQDPEAESEAAAVAPAATTAIAWPAQPVESLLVTPATTMVSVPMGPRRNRPWGIVPLDANALAARQVAHQAKAAKDAPAFQVPLCLRSHRRRLTRRGVLSEIAALRSQGWRIDVGREPLTGSAIVVANKPVPRSRVERRGGPGSSAALLRSMATSASAFAQDTLEKDAAVLQRLGSMEDVEALLDAAAKAKEEAHEAAGLPSAVELQERAEAERSKKGKGKGKGKAAAEETDPELEKKLAAAADQYKRALEALVLERVRPESASDEPSESAGSGGPKTPEASNSSPACLLVSSLPPEAI